MWAGLVKEKALCIAPEKYDFRGGIHLMSEITNAKARAQKATLWNALLGGEKKVL